MKTINPDFLIAALDELSRMAPPKEEIPVGVETLEFLKKLFEYHPIELTRFWFSDELDKLLKS